MENERDEHFHYEFSILKKHQHMQLQDKIYFKENYHIETDEESIAYGNALIELILTKPKVMELLNHCGIKPEELVWNEWQMNKGRSDEDHWRDTELFDKNEYFDTDDGRTIKKKGKIFLRVVIHKNTEAYRHLEPIPVCDECGRPL